MKTQKITLSTLFVAIALLMSINTYAQHGHGQGNRNNNCSEKYHQGHNNYHGNFLKTLDLTDEQQGKIEILKNTHMEKMLSSRNILKEKEAKLITLSSEKGADMKAINSQIDEIGALKIVIMKERAAHQQEVRKLLSDEQRIKFDMHKSKHQSRGKGHGHGKGYGKN